MKLERKTAQQLALPALVAVAMLGAGIAAVSASEFYLRKVRVERQTAAEERRAAQDKLARATSEEREIREKLVDYRRLLERGIIGDEQRLDWVDTISQIKTARRIHDIKYAISPQKTFEVPGTPAAVAGASAGGDVEFRVSELKLEMQLLHEEDLLGFLEDLRRQLKTHVMVRSCSISRVERGGGFERSGASPRLAASCLVDLVTIRDRKLKI
jgi:hypothetical protein